MYTYKYPRPAVTTDIVVWAIDKLKNEVDILLIKRKNEPFKGYYAFPGGFLDEQESAEQCAIRELEEETGLTQLPLIQMHTFSKPGRDPRGHTVSIVFFTLVDKSSVLAKAGDDAAQVEWINFNHAFGDILFAFDHKDILNYSALFVWRNIFLHCDFSSPKWLFYPFLSLLGEQAISLLKNLLTNVRL